MMQRKLLLAKLSSEWIKSKGGGKKAVAKQEEKNKLTAREQVDYLKDTDKPFIEVGGFVGMKCMKNMEAALQVEL